MGPLQIFVFGFEHFQATGLRDALRNAGVVFAQQDFLTPEGLVALGGLLGLDVALDAAE